METATIFLTLPEELKERVRVAAAEEHRSVNAQLRHWIERALAERRAVVAGAEPAAG